MSFTVFARARPIRVAFLFPEDTKFDVVCDSLSTWCMSNWGGRYSSVGLLQDDALSEDDWGELIRFDPDYVYSFGALGDELLRQLNEKVGPWHISEHPEAVPRPGTALAQGQESNETTANPSEWREESIQVPGIPTPPTEQNMEFLQKTRFQKSPLLLFEFGKDCPALFRRFLHRNLGTYYQWSDGRSDNVRRIAWMENLLPKISVERLRVDDFASLCSALGVIAGSLPGEVGNGPLGFTAPCELSSVHLPRSVSFGSFEHMYRLVIGSEPRDFTLYWRSCMNDGPGIFAVPFRHCLWIPSELIREESFVTVLHRWLYYLTNQGSSHFRAVEITSQSLSPDELSPLLAAFRDHRFRIEARLVRAEDLNERWHLERSAHEAAPRFIPPLGRASAERFVAVERKQTWELRAPDVIQAAVPVGTWAVDVQIQREPGIEFVRKESWWNLPRRSGDGVVRAMFSTPARITRSGLFSVQVEQTQTLHGTPNPPNLHLHVPQDAEVVPALIVDLGNPLYLDARREALRNKSVVSNIELSDAGRKLRGLIELFGGFWRAQHYWARTFWRETFYRMAGRAGHYDSAFHARVENLVGKELERLTPACPEADRGRAATRISQRILGLIGERLPGTAISSAQMEQERAWFEQLHGYETQSAGGQTQVQYLAGDAMVQMVGFGPVTSAEFKEGLRDLVALRVLRMGMDVRCPRCRLQEWIPTDLLRQSNECSGCGASLDLLPETAWTYRLNSLIHHSVNSRVLAVWQALAELASRPGCFFFTPSSEVHFKRPINGRAKRELDVLCVTDGSLLIGEVKTGDLHVADFNEFGELAQVLRPDRAAMFVSEEHVQPKVKEWFNEFRARLAAFGVRGELFVLPRY